MQTGMTKGVNENESDECTRNNIFCDLLTSLKKKKKTAMDDACRPGNPKDPSFEYIKNLYLSLM